MASGWRSVIRNAEFDEQLAGLIPWEPWADEYLAAAEDLLARLPSSGIFIARESGADIWKLPLQPIKDRAVELYYSFDQRVVVLLWIVSYE